LASRWWIYLKKEIFSLIGVLKEERDSYKNLLKIAQEEQKIIVSGTLNDLEVIVAAIEKLLVICGELERKRLGIFNVLVRDKNLEGIENLSDFSEHLDETSSKQIRKIQKEIFDTLKELGNISKSNAEILEKNLNYVDFLLKSITDEQVYQENAEKKKSSDAKLFNKRI